MKMRPDAGIANRLLALCVPLTPLTSSSLPIFAWAGWIAVAVAAVSAATSLCLDGKRLSIDATLIGVTIACLMVVGILFHGPSSQAAYEQLIVLLVFGIVFLDYRRVVAGRGFHVACLVLVVLALVSNLTLKSTYALLLKDKAWASPIFQNPNVFGIVFAILTIFCFLSMRSIPAGRMKTLFYVLCTILVFFVAASGCRGALLTVIVFFSVYALGHVFRGNKRLLWGGAAATLIMVPIFVFGYLIAVGAPMNVFPKGASQVSSTWIRSTPACVPSSTVVCPPVKAAMPDDTPTGRVLGHKKTITSGRDKIWPAVIELAGRSPLWGHGLGSSPGPFLAQPFTGTNSHNGFLEVYYRLGLIGLALYTLLWCLLFKRAIGVSDLSARSASVAVLCATCVLDTIEVVFIQGNPGIGLALAILATTEFTGKGAEAPVNI